MSISIKVICRKDRLNKHNTAPLYICSTLNRKKKMVSLGINPNPDYWDGTTQTISTECPDKADFEAKIASKLSEYKSRIKKLHEANELTLENLFKETQTRRYKFLDDYFLMVIERLQSLGKYTSADKHKTVFSMLKRYHLEKIRFEDIDVIFLRDFEYFLKERRNNSNSIATKMSVFKAVYNKALYEELFSVLIVLSQDTRWQSLEAYKKRAITYDHALAFLNVSGRTIRRY